MHGTQSIVFPGQGSQETHNFYVNFGGHSAACGFTIKKSDENIFRERFYRAVDDMVEADPGILKKNYKYDLKVDVSDMNL